MFFRKPEIDAFAQMAWMSFHPSWATSERVEATFAQSPNVRTSLWGRHLVDARSATERRDSTEGDGMAVRMGLVLDCADPVAP